MASLTPEPPVVMQKLVMQKLVMQKVPGPMVSALCPITVGSRARTGAAGIPRKSAVTTMGGPSVAEWTRQLWYESGLIHHSSGGARTRETKPAAVRVERGRRAIWGWSRNAPAASRQRLGTTAEDAVVGRFNVTTRSAGRHFP